MGFGGRRPAAGLLIVAALSACAAPTPSSRSPAASEPAIASVAASASAAILFRLERNEVASWVPHATLYDDGRLLRWDRSTDRLTVQQLSATGIDALLADVRASGSFEASHNVVLQPLPGVDPPGMDLPADRFTVAVAGAEPIVVITNPYRDPLIFQSSAERDALIVLAQRVLDTSWLPADAWIDETARPFVADAYLVFSGVYASPGLCSGNAGDFCSRDVTTLDLPFALPPEGLGTGFTSADGTQSVINHCALIKPDLANALAAGLWPEFRTAAGHLYLVASIPWRARSASYDLTLRPLFPEEAPGCGGKSLPPAIGP